MNTSTIRLEGGIKRGKAIRIFVDGQPVPAYEGETIASALMAAGRFVSRTINDRPLGVYCNIGICHSCVMTVDDVPGVRICRTPVSDGLRVKKGDFRKRANHEI
jgi:predicted molibdopterin-dependent oxidoreductase YjgC